MRRPAARLVPLAVVLAVVAAVGGPPDRAALGAAASGAPVIAAAGDIACAPGMPGWNGGAGRGPVCRQRATSDLLVGRGYAAVLPLGDLQYETGTLAAFRTSYDRSWGRVKGISRPVVGNHEYRTPGAAGYWDYWGGRAGPRGRGWYSYDVGAWHLVTLNSNCGAVGCGPDSEQVRWLRADLARHPRRCTLVAWHHPRFSSGYHGSNPSTETLWRTVHAAGADVVLTGHDHGYERLAPVDRDGRVDGAGVRQFVVGTGGKSGTRFTRPPLRSTVVRRGDTPGVLRMTLRPDGYDWRFVPAAGFSFTDAGSGRCR